MKQVVSIACLGLAGRVGGHSLFVVLLGFLPLLMDASQVGAVCRSSAKVLVLATEMIHDHFVNVVVGTSSFDPEVGIEFLRIVAFFFVDLQMTASEAPETLQAHVDGSVLWRGLS